MLLVFFGLISIPPLTILQVKSESVPTILKYEHYFYIPLFSKTKLKNLRLECLAKGRPDPEIEFYFHAKDVSHGTLLKDIPRVKNISKTEIEIQHVFATDAGTYRCVARNKHGRVLKNKKVFVAFQGAFYKNANYKDPTTTLEVKLGRQQEIICPVKEKPYPLKFAWGTKPAPGRRPYFQQQSERIHITENGDLYFSYIKQSDVDNINNVGGVSCIMYHEGHPIYSRKHKLKIVDYNISYAAPSLHVKLPGVSYLMKGQGKTLRCIGGGNPTPHITWFIDGVQISPNDLTYGIDLKEPGIMNIHSFESNMAGNYKCTLTNRLGTTHSDGNVLLAAAPFFKKPFQERSPAYRDNRLELQCNAIGTMPIRYEWYKDGKVLTPYQTFESRMMINGGKILISPVTDTTQGTYQCYALNSYGNSYTKTKVFVQDPVVVTAKKRDAPKEKPKKVAEVMVTESKQRRFKTGGRPLQLKYILIIACSGIVCLVLIGGSICICCRSNVDAEKIIYVPPGERRDKDENSKKSLKKDINRLDLKQQLLSDMYKLPPPPPSLTDQSDDDFSSYGGHRSSQPLYYNDHMMMSLSRHKDVREENL